MLCCEESLVAKLDPIGESKFLSVQPCHKEETTLTHEGASIASEEGTSDSCTNDCSSGTSARKNLTEVTSFKFDSVSDFSTESHIDHDESSQVKNLLKLMYLMNLAIHLKSLEGLLGPLRAFYQVIMSQLFAIRGMSLLNLEDCSILLQKC